MRTTHIIRYIVLSAAFLVGLQGCYNEAELTPSGTEPVLSENDLPQGTNDYDQRIMEYWEDYGLLTFYRFNDKEFWWTPTLDIRPKPASGTEGGTSAGYEGVQADEDFVGDLVDMLDREFFAYYQEEYLKGRMPKKFLLMSELFRVPSSSLDPEFAPKNPIYVHIGYDRFAVNMASEDILGMQPEDKKAFRDAIHSGFLNWQADKGYVRQSDAFLAVTTYGKSYAHSSETTIRNFYADGLISVHAALPGADWKAYITAIVTHTYEELTGNIDPAVYVNGKFNANQWKSAADQSLGMLNRNTTTGWDKNGLINKKYEIVTKFFIEEYGIDLQAIGNANPR